MTRPLLLLGVVLGLAATGCAGGSGEDSADDPVAKPPSRLGVGINLPSGWHARVRARSWPLPGGALVHFANFPLPAGDDDAATKAEKALARDDVVVTVVEALPGTELPVQRPQLEPGERGARVGGHTVFERFFVASGRSFLIHAVFGAHPPPEQLVRGVNAALAGLSIARRSEPLKPAPDPPPARALAPVRLARTPIRVVNQCRLAQAQVSFPVLCPARLPRPFLAWPRGRPPTVSAERIPGGVSVGYGAPWEPDSGPDWRLHLWRNRPCCFLHFEVFRRPPGRQRIPAGARAAELGGRRGLLRDASSWGAFSAGGDYLYWANHTRFLWRERGVDYVATLHRFGTVGETRALLDRLLRELRPLSRGR